ncbi:Pkinase-domain-containing protein [Dacryopinax primogenitus]|uniref:Serine/threonine-protein kinase n=1 Tax=Dacryopinax primogenitus (strain DJM 731) TaxID=1858805 RepID=M5GDC8_DACPD|nr:Pkinase-domain-containing protein [Dacryopinax primogenitus]EJU02268.1 Pkinase-domain-containing protein [Dacryopinax primogenitus]
MSGPVVTRAPSAPALTRHSKPRVAPLNPVSAPVPPPKPSVPPPVPTKDQAAKDDKEKRRKSKGEFKDPPKVVHDQETTQSYTVLNLLGQGGFARVYEARDGEGKSVALKVINKTKLADTKARTRLYAEIKIHRMLSHPHVCAFGDCFEDKDNVYITLELCRAGSLMDFVRRRARLSEPEVRLYMVQLAGSISYLHTHQIIHRDLKLGNLFLDDRLELKVGDFGLAALLEREGERKTTICGTPNYIAPEVLFASKTHGHSYEVDIWSMGVIMFTMLAGKPPFQTEKVEDIYRRIKESKYEFPTTFEISENAKNLVQKLLSQKPEDRPTPQNLLSHPFFTEGHTPLWMSQVSRTSAPNFTPDEIIKAPANLKALRKRAQIDDVGTIRVRREGVLSASAANGSSAQANAAKAWEDGEKEFENAVNVGSPISTLLKSAKQPLLVTGEPVGENLMRKLSVAGAKRASAQKDRDAPSSPAKSTTTRVAAARTRLGALQRVSEEDDLRGPRATRAASVAGQRRTAREMHDSENVPPQGMAASTRARSGTVTQATASVRSGLPVLSRGASLTSLHRQPSVGAGASAGAGLVAAAAASAEGRRRQEPPTNAGGERTNAFDLTAKTLNEAFEARADGRVWRDPALDAGLPGKVVFVQSWVDYSHKYGMGYALTDGTTAVYFNDSTSLVLSPDDNHMDYVKASTDQRQYVRSFWNMRDFSSSGSLSNALRPRSATPTQDASNSRPRPRTRSIGGSGSGSNDSTPSSDLSSKVTLLRAFKDYIYKELYRQQNYTYVDVEKVEGMDFVQRWWRANNVTMFKLSNNAIQFNYSDHTKIILSYSGRYVTYVDKTYNLHEHTLAELMATAVAPPESKTDKNVRSNEQVLKRLRYCREVLNTMQRKNLNGEEGNPQIPAAARGTARTAGLR